MVPFLFALKYYYVQKILFRRLTVICHLADHFFHSILRIRKNNDGTKEKRWEFTLFLKIFGLIIMLMLGITSRRV